MKKTLNHVLMILLLFLGCQSSPKIIDRQIVIPQTEPSVLTENARIHYTGKYCSECHEQTPIEGGEKYLKFNGDYTSLCGRCHKDSSPGYCHPLDVDLKQVSQGKMPKDFPLVDGKFTCDTCHDVYKQCQKRQFDLQSLRGAPYPRKADFCYQCHDGKKYQKLNAHHQILTDGSLNVKMCLYCHENKPDEKTATYTDVSFIGDIKALCRRCHQIKGNHAGNFDHMATNPSAEGRKRMEAMKEKHKIILPLAEDGKMTCATCHNPHQKGVIPADKPSAKGADSPFRQRLAGKMCTECHQM